MAALLENDSHIENNYAIFISVYNFRITFSFDWLLLFS